MSKSVALGIAEKDKISDPLASWAIAKRTVRAVKLPVQMYYSTVGRSASSWARLHLLT
jgi:hypothetical protein